MIEADEIFKQIKEDSQTDRQVITETNYIIEELKDYTKIYSENNNKCRYCGGNLKLVEDKINERLYLECKECQRVTKG